MRHQPSQGSFSWSHTYAIIHNLWHGKSAIWLLVMHLTKPTILVIRWRRRWWVWECLDQSDQLALFDTVGVVNTVLIEYRFELFHTWHCYLSCTTANTSWSGIDWCSCSEHSLLPSIRPILFHTHVTGSKTIGQGRAALLPCHRGLSQTIQNLACGTERLYVFFFWLEFG